MPEVLFITGTDTNVGKTVLAGLLVRRLVQRGLRVHAAKPFCSGGRDDALVLHAALGGLRSLDEINPWHFPEPISPLQAARKAGIKVGFDEAVGHLRKLREDCDALVIEGAGGLLSPLGEGFSSLELLLTMKAKAVVVCPNRLGAVNQSRLVLAALPSRFAGRAELVLMSSPKPGPIGRLNRELLGEFIAPNQIHELPWLAGDSPGKSARLSSRICAVLDRIAGRR